MPTFHGFKGLDTRRKKRGRKAKFISELNQVRSSGLKCQATRGIRKGMRALNPITCKGDGKTYNVNAIQCQKKIPGEPVWCDLITAWSRGSTYRKYGRKWVQEHPRSKRSRKAYLKAWRKKQKAKRKHR